MAQNDWFRKCTLLIVVLALSACSSFDPYQRSKQMDLPVERLAQDALTVDGKKGYDALAGNLHGAVAAIKDQRSEWVDSLSTQAKVRAGTQLGVIGVSAVALFNGLRTGVSNDGGKKDLALAGALAGGAYAASDYYSNTAQEDAYIEGIRGLTCALLAIEPLRMTLPAFENIKTEQVSLTLKINELDQKLLKAEASLRYPDGDKSPAALVRDEASSALYRARTTLRSSNQLVWELDKSGITLLREGDLVFANVAAKIKASNKVGSKPQDYVNNLTAILGKFREVKIDVASETSTPKAPTPMAPGSEPEIKPTATSTVSASKSVTATVSAIAASASVVPSDTLLSQASITALINQVALNLQKQTAKQQKDANEKQAKEQAELDKKTARAKEAASRATMSAAEAQAACLAAKREDCFSPLDSVSVGLANATAELYKARRPLSNQLVVFNSARAAVNKNRACTGGGSPMTVSPDADANVEPGQVYVITINNVTTPPTVNLKGDAAFKYLVGPSVNQYTYQIEVGKEAKGAIDLSISDRGLATEEIKLTVVQKK